MMSCYQGLLAYCEIVKSSKCGNAQSTKPPVEEIFKAVVMTAEDIVKEEINLVRGGACSEAWFHGARKQYLPYLRRR